jgi:hypothetical protein
MKIGVLEVCPPKISALELCAEKTGFLELRLIQILRH